MRNPNTDLVQALEKLIDAGLTLAEVQGAFAARRDPIDLAFVKEAQELFNDAGTLEVDDHALTSRSADSEGAYIQAWVWVEPASRIQKAMKANPDLVCMGKDA